MCQNEREREKRCHIRFSDRIATYAHIVTSWSRLWNSTILRGKFTIFSILGKYDLKWSNMMPLDCNISCHIFLVTYPHPLHQFIERSSVHANLEPRVSEEDALSILPPDLEFLPQLRCVKSKLQSCAIDIECCWLYLLRTHKYMPNSSATTHHHDKK